MESNWAGPAETRLTAYIEHNEGVPVLAIQDTLNVDQSQIGVDLTNITENRGVAGCNGNTDGYSDTCYSFGGTNRNGKIWRAEQIYFSDDPGPTYKNDWHFIEAQFALNSIAQGKGVPDGVLRMWYDGDLIIDYQDVLFRTGENPNMKFNQLLIAPYIGGSGSPIDQTFWVDELTISTTKSAIGGAAEADFDGDGNVDGADLTIWEGAYGLSNAADADDDGDSDGADFLMWQRQFDGNPGAASSIPEPASGAFFVLAAISLLAGRRRSHR
ncbi:MAG: hypothetical protein GXP30_06785 [Verrucomicrobia bacterium]|nr:hypothetical protein [Verrucomicrobiota bacterium]